MLNITEAEPTNAVFHFPPRASIRQTKNDHPQPPTSPPFQPTLQLFPPVTFPKRPEKTRELDPSSDPSTGSARGRKFVLSYHVDPRTCQRSSVLCLVLSNRAIGSSNRASCRVVSVSMLLASAPMAEAAALHVALMVETPAPRGI